MVSRCVVLILSHLPRRPNLDPCDEPAIALANPDALWCKRGSRVAILGNQDTFWIPDAQLVNAYQSSGSKAEVVGSLIKGGDRNAEWHDLILR